MADLRGIDAQMRDTKKKLAVAVRAAGTSLTDLFGAGLVIAAIVIGDVRDVSRFPHRPAIRGPFSLRRVREPATAGAGVAQGQDGIGSPLALGHNLRGSVPGAKGEASGTARQSLPS